jgi:peptidylprolyl isomerase
MKLKLPLVAAFVAVLGLTACGGGGGSSGTPSSPVSSPASLTTTNAVLGTGASASAGSVLTTNYTMWLYDASASTAGFKGAQVGTSVGGSVYSFVIGVTPAQVIAGVDQGALGMQVGGKRTMLIPASLAYGAAGSGSIPPNSGLVFEVELIALQPAISSPATLVKTDTLVGTGVDVTAGKVVKVNYTGWLYDASVAGFKGAQFETTVGKTPFSFTIGTGAVIAGWDQGVLGMKVGGKRTLYIPASLGYGAAGGGSAIPPNSGLVFDIEVVSAQ